MNADRTGFRIGLHQLIAVLLGYVLIVFCVAAYASLVWWHRQITGPEYGALYAAVFVALVGGSASVAAGLWTLIAPRFPLQLLLWGLILAQLPLMVIGAFGLVRDTVVPVVGALFALGLLLGLYRGAIDTLLARTCHIAEAAHLDYQTRAAMWLAIGLGTVFGVTLARLEPATASLWILMLSSSAALCALFVPDLLDEEPAPGLTRPVRSVVFDQLMAWLAIDVGWGFAIGALGTLVFFGEFESPLGPGALLVVPVLGHAFGSLGRVTATRGREELCSALFGLLVAAIGLLALMLTSGPVLRNAAWFVTGMGLGCVAPSTNTLVRQFHVPNPLARQIQASRILTGIAVLLGILAAFNLGQNVTPLLLALALAGTAAVLFWKPATILELLLRIRTNGSRMLRVLDVGNVPDDGPVLFVTGHLGVSDLLIVRQGLPRHTRFLLPVSAATPDFRHALELLDPVLAPFDTPDSSALASALLELRETWQAGGAVCVMNEGHFEASHPDRGRFAHLFWRLVKHYKVKIVPVAVNRGWGELCKVRGLYASLITQLRVGQPIDMSFGDPMPPATAPWEVRDAVQLLAAEQMIARRSLERTLPWYFLRATKRYASSLCMADTTGQELTYRQVLQRLIVLARMLRRRLASDEHMVGLVLPPSVGGTLFNLALTMIGRVPVNLNFTASEESLRSAIAQCGIRTIFTSEKLLRRLGLQLPIEPVLVESLRDDLRTSDKLLAAIGGYVCPLWVVERFIFRTPRARADDLLTVIFSSGSTGDPKGVMLTHHNVLSNCQGVIQVLQPTPSDRLVATLPLFHSFGFLANNWVPFFVGAAAIYHTSPLEPRQIGEITRKYGGTILVSTPTFLRSYIRRIPPEDFATLRLVITGAEKLPATVASAFKERFGVEPMEGYGCTELSPVACVNTDTFRGADGLQIGPKFGTVGHPITGVAVQIRDIETDARLGPGQDGMLLVKGPNVMKGYLKRPALTKQVVVDGWYITGDVARVDSDGFVTITDRLARFSKIAGEMVPHVRIEEALRQAIGSEEVGVAVVGVPDPQKGERLVVLHEPLPIDLDTVYERLKGLGLPNLWIPDKSMFFQVEALPVLASGKLDLRRARQLALDLVSAAQASRAAS